MALAFLAFAVDCAPPSASICASQLKPTFLLLFFGRFLGLFQRLLLVSTQEPKLASNNQWLGQVARSSGSMRGRSWSKIDLNLILSRCDYTTHLFLPWRIPQPSHRRLWYFSSSFAADKTHAYTQHLHLSLFSFKVIAFIFFHLYIFSLPKTVSHNIPTEFAAHIFPLPPPPVFQLYDRFFPHFPRRCSVKLI